MEMEIRDVEEADFLGEIVFVFIGEHREGDEEMKGGLGDFRVVAW